MQGTQNVGADTTDATDAPQSLSSSSFPVKSSHSASAVAVSTEHTFSSVSPPSGKQKQVQRGANAISLAPSQVTKNCGASLQDDESFVSDVSKKVHLATVFFVLQ